MDPASESRCAGRPWTPILLALSLGFAFVSGCKDPPPPAPVGDSAGQPPPATAGKPVAPEALAEPAAPAPAVAATNSAATPSPPPAAPLPATGRSEPDKQVGASNTPTPALPPTPQAVAAAPVTAASPAEAPSAAVAQNPEPPAVQVLSPKTTEAAFNLWMQSSGRYKAGQPGHVEIVLVPKGDYHCNEQYPYKFKPAGSSGVTFPQAIVMGESMSKSAARSVMRVPFVPASPGDARIAGKFHFSVCTASQCLMDSREVAVTVKVD